MEETKTFLRCKWRNCYEKVSIYHSGELGLRGRLLLWRILDWSCHGPRFDRVTSKQKGMAETLSFSFLRQFRIPFYGETDTLKGETRYG